MQILLDSPGDTSGETSSESSSSPQTPLDAGGHFVHVATMNQPIAHDSLYTQNYSLPAESGCLDHLSQAAGLSYTNGGVQESSRRDNELNHQSSGLTRPLGHRATANDPTFHPPPEQSSGSISTSPSSNNSSAAYSFTGNQRSSFHSPLSLPNLQQPFASAQPLPANSTTTYAFSGMPARTAEHTPSYLPSQQLPSQRIGYSSNIPVSPNGISRRQTYAAIPNLPGPGKLYQATPGADSDRYGYGSTIYSSLSSDSTRLLSSGLSMPAPSTAYSTQVATASDTMTPPFSEQQTFYEIYSGQSQTDLVKPHIDAKIEKGFFYSNDNCWTCYRRNYFAVQCSYQLTPHHSSLPHFLNKDGKNYMIQAMAMSLSARVDGTGGKAIELVQHTPKRDKGPQSQIQITKLCPTPPGGKLGHLPHADTHGHYGLIGGYGGPGTAHVAPPYFPMQSHPDPNAQQQDPSNAHHSNTTTPTAHQHTFERIQFKSATANNGKRRAQQQYYHLIVELHADIRDASSSRPNWVKVAERVSSQVVVRGRSPSHYSNEGPNSASNNRGTGGAAGGYGGMAGYGGYGGLPATGGSSMSRPFGGAYGLGGGYRGNQLAMDPMSSHTVSSSSSVAGTDGYMDHSSNMILTSQAAPDYMQPTPAVFSSAGSLPSIFGLPKIEDKFGYIPSRIPPPEVGVHTTVY